MKHKIAGLKEGETPKVTLATMAAAMLDLADEGYIHLGANDAAGLRRVLSKMRDMGNAARAQLGAEFDAETTESAPPIVGELLVELESLLKT